MRAALEAVAGFLSKYGAVDESAVIMQVIDKMGFALPDNSPLRWRALIGTLRKELEDGEDPVDYVVLFERLLQLYLAIPNPLCRALFSSPLLLHVLVERFEVTFTGISAELFREERADLCRADGIYDICLLIQDKLFPVTSGAHPLGAFLESFTDVFRDSEDPKCRWTELYNKHRINDAAFRRDMMRALCVIESAAIGDTEIERAFPASDSDYDGPVKLAPRQLLELKFDGSSELWADLSVVHSIQVTEEHHRSSTAQVSNEQGQRARQEEEQGIWTTTVPRTDADTTTNSEDECEDEEPPRPRRTRRARANAPTTATTDAEPVASADADDASDAASSSAASATGRGGRRKRKRWSSEEVQALLDGYAEFGEEPNVWVLIKGKHADVLRDRSNVDLKDKHRNLQKFGKIPRVD